VEFVTKVGLFEVSVPTVVLQPWEGMTTSAVLESAGNRAPRKIPAAACRALITIGYTIGLLLPPVKGLVRRVELMWLGQEQDAAWARSVGLEKGSYVADVFKDMQETMP
jgi:hypothetical protein